MSNNYLRRMTFSIPFDRDDTSFIEVILERTMYDTAKITVIKDTEQKTIELPPEEMRALINILKNSPYIFSLQNRI